MNTNSLIHQSTLNIWADRIREQQASGLRIIDWCRRNNFSRDQFYYWKRLLKETVIDKSIHEIVPVLVNTPAVSKAGCTTRTTGTTCTTSLATVSPGTIKITIGTTSIEIASNILEPLLVSVIKAVKYT